MVNREVYPLGLDLVLKSMTLVGPPAPRPGENQFSKEDLRASYRVARQRFHV